MARARDEFGQFAKGVEYEYFINLNERGSFFADVRNSNGRTVYEISSDEETGEVWPIEDGFMCHTHDVDGLGDYLRDAGIIPKTASLVFGEGGR